MLNINVAKTIIKCDLSIAFRNRQEMINPLIFFAMIIVLFPLAVGTDTTLLKNINAGIIWVTALLASTLSLDIIFRSDFEDGTIEQYTLANESLITIVSAKIFTHWLVSGFPLMIIATLTGFLLSIDVKVLTILFVTLLIGTPILSLIGAVAVALTIGLRGGMLLSLLILPLYMPILIFSMLAVSHVNQGIPVTAELYFLTGMLVLAITLAPITAAASLRIRLS
ncbi:MAG: heme exporter protein CcmB [Pseudomonadota bacterium]